MLKRLLLAATLLLSPTAASAKWHEASTDHFVVYADQDPEKLRAFATKLERFDAAMRTLYRTEDRSGGGANRLTVYMVSDVGAVQRLASRSNIGGFYSGRASGSVAFVPRRAGGGDIGDMSADTIFFHEYTHHFLLGSYDGALPAWFTEGYAEFFSTARIDPDGSVGIGIPAHHRAYGIHGRERLALPKMLSGDYAKLSPAEWESLYGRGWLLTHYLNFEAARSGQLAAYLKAIDDGKPAGEAATAAFGDLKKLERDLDAYAKRRMLNYRKVTPDDAVIGKVAVRPLRPGEAALMPIRLQSVRGVNEKTAPKLVAGARRAAAPYPNDPVAQAWLAEVEHDAGNLAEAEAAADRALAVSPKSSDGLIYKGRNAMKQAALLAADKPAMAAKLKEARNWFVKASRADTEDAEPKVLFHATYLMADAPPTRNAVEGLLYAQQLVPQDNGLRLQVVHQHLKDGKAAEARRLLGPVAYNPHGGTMRIWAAAIMIKLNADDAKGALALWAAPAEAEKN